MYTKVLQSPKEIHFCIFYIYILNHIIQPLTALSIWLIRREIVITLELVNLNSERHRKQFLIKAIPSQRSFPDDDSVAV